MSSPTPDYYLTLGVPRTASPQEIRREYQRLALLNHPDKNKSDIEAATRRFQLIAAAYAVLSDAKARRRYDRCHPWARGRCSETKCECEDENVEGDAEAEAESTPKAAPKSAPARSKPSMKGVDVNMEMSAAQEAWRRSQAQTNTGTNPTPASMPMPIPKANSPRESRTWFAASRKESEKHEASSLVGYWTLRRERERERV